MSAPHRAGSVKKFDHTKWVARALGVLGASRVGEVVEVSASNRSIASRLRTVLLNTCYKRRGAPEIETRVMGKSLWVSRKH